MASLDLATLRRGRVMTFITKMEKGVKSQKPEYMFTKMNGRKVFLRTLSYAPGGRIQYYEIIKHKKNIIDLLNSGTALPGLKFVDISGNDTMSLADLEATEEFGGKANRGDIAEIIYSAAIAARFMNRETYIKPDDVEWVLRRISGTSHKQRLGPWRTETAQKGVYDTVFWSFDAPMITIVTLANQFNRKQKDIQHIINRAVAYANSDVIRANIAAIGANDKTNIIEVMAQGTFAKSEKSIDVKVKIDNHFVNLTKSITTQTTSVKGGTSYALQNKLMTQLFGIPVSSAAISAYTKQIGKGVTHAIYAIYLEYAKDLDRRFRNMGDPIYKNMPKNLSNTSKQKIQGTWIQMFNQNEHKMLTSGNLKTGLEMTNRRFKVEAHLLAGIPHLLIKDTVRSEVFLKICIKRAPGVAEVWNNYIEKGIAFDKLMKVLG